MDSYSVYQGSELVIGNASNPVVINDSFDVPIPGYDGSETLTTELWPGGTRSASCTPTASWIVPANATITITLSAAESTALAPGRYRGLVRVQPVDQDAEDAYAFTVDVLGASGTADAPTTYTTFDHLLLYGRSWLRQLQTDDDQAGFAEQQGRARSWIEDLAHAHYRVASMTMVIGSQAFGPRRSGARSVWLQEQLDADYLMVTDQVREAAAKKALAFICEGQIGLNDSAEAYARLARMYHSQADYIGTCLTLSLDTNSDGFADVTIDCSCTDPLYG
jgi:hypothetical protein